MNDSPTVYVRARKRSNGKPPNYHLQWIDPKTGKWRSEKGGRQPEAGEPAIGGA